MKGKKFYVKLGKNASDNLCIALHGLWGEAVKKSSVF